MRSATVLAALAVLVLPSFAHAAPVPANAHDDDAGQTQLVPVSESEPEAEPAPTSSPAPVSPHVAAPAPSEPAPQEETGRQYMSDRRGAYFSGAIGFGMPIYWSPYTGVGEPWDGTEGIRSPGLNTGFSIGGAPARGFVMGFTLDTNVGPAKFRDDYRDQQSGVTGFDGRSGRAHAVGAGFFLQGYIRNFFLRAGFSGLGVFFIDETGSDGNESVGGMGADFAMGVHFPVAPKAALGFSTGLRVAFWDFDNADYRGKEYILQPMVRFEAVVF